MIAGLSVSPCIKKPYMEKYGYDKLPDDALAAIQKVVDELN